MVATVPITSSLGDIYTQDALSAQTERWKQLLHTFESTYKTPATFVSRSPGRVNIIGEHIDYSLYPVLPMAITSDAIFAVSCPSDSALTSSKTFKIRISNVESEKFSAQDFDIPYDRIDIDIDSKIHEWTNYFKCGLKGALEFLGKTYGTDFRPKGMNVLMDGSVPAGSGLSSSAAFVSGSALAVMVANGVKNVSKMDLTEIAIVAERAVGINSGGMDQSASVLSLRSSALYVSFMPTLAARPVKFPDTNPELTFLIAQSFIAADKHVTGPVCYNLRVVECTLAAAYLHAILNDTKKPPPADSGPLGISLHGFQKAYFRKRNSTQPITEQLQEIVKLTRSTLSKEQGYTREEIANAIGLTVSELEHRYESTFPVRAETFKLRQRALHVFSEALRVSKFIELLEHPAEHLARGAGDSMESYNCQLGDLMNESQCSCRDLYECSCPELDELCSIARKAGSYGSRLTGAGWGGCSVHLVPTAKVEAVREAWEKEYYSKRNLTEEQKKGAVVVSKPGSGSAVLFVGKASL
ncbi:galactokinase [Pseudogymnoascus australis]